MATKIVDIYDDKGKLLACYPVTLGGVNYEPAEAEYLDAGLASYRKDNPGTTAKVRAQIRQ